ncbi:MULTISPECIES: MBL fold metallo-hydrolase [Mesorhizobium]|uniref:MBL fold metallo-hydrolase n=1 Tax=Mesorhizobium denitrificans TaxID=2294114 RepID=A0A371X4L8_9HYPH|nr:MULTISPECIES: MBL fold metallo-hydrolase [Mesorhizobium]RFC63974.1 MBL fold metallo-hydrolase [Mesorhizobium denitrificans]
MAGEAFRVKFWGVRGSIPVSGAEFMKVGGNTACIEMRCGSHTLIFDAGSGIRGLGEALHREGIAKLDLFFTHCHYDHIIGFPFFPPLYDRQTKLTIWSGHLAGRMTTQEMIETFVSPPWFPGKIGICRAKFQWEDFVSGDVLMPQDGVVIRTASLNHPGGCIGYRVEWNGKVAAYVSDTEHVSEELDEAVLGLMKNADLAIYDCTYTEAEMPHRVGFGHSTWERGVRLCEAAGAKRLAIFHHDPARTDAELAKHERAAQEAFEGAFVARDGLTLNL